MRDQKSNSPATQSPNLVWVDDDNRIDWDRKSQKKKRQNPETLPDDGIDHLPAADLDFSEVTRQHKKHKSGKRDKRRQLVMDESSGHVRVKRRRKHNRNPLDAWLEEYE